MSERHLNALQDALIRHGWRIVGVLPGDDHRLSATWELNRSEKEALLIDFFGMSPDGDRCLPLIESYGCRCAGQFIAPALFSTSEPKSTVVGKRT